MIHDNKKKGRSFSIFLFSILPGETVRQQWKHVTSSATLSAPCVGQSGPYSSTAHRTKYLGHRLMVAYSALARGEAYKSQSI
jgi:hypothetical protein